MIRTGLIASDNYDEWMYIEGAWELIGNTRVDLSDYLRKEDFELTAGTGLKITGESNFTPRVEIDEEIVFVFYGGSSTEVI
jgi:hypothetical protein